MKTSATVTPAGLHRTVMCCCRSCLKVSYFSMRRSHLIFLSVDDLPHLYSTKGCLSPPSPPPVFFFFFFFLHKLLFLGTPKQLHSVCWTQPDSSSRKVARTEDTNDILFPKQLGIAVTCSSLDARWRLTSVCVNRNRFSGADGVTGCRFASLPGPDYWEFDVLYQKNPTCEEVR